MKMFSRLLKVSPLLVVPLLEKQNNNVYMNEAPLNFQKNSIKERIHIKVEVSNHPCEDRSDTYELKSINGYAAAVYDGHGGWQVSQLCKEVLLKKLDQILERNKTKYVKAQDLIQASIKQAFLETQNDFLKAAQIGYSYGFGRMARAGSCALICVVHDNKLYAGNVGDSLGLLLNQETSTNQVSFTEINRFLNADNKDEQERLKHQFPNEPDIVYCKRQNMTSCYVKGRLQPTRSIGDLRLKYQEFNNPKQYAREYDFQPALKIFTGPYITAEPEIKVFNLSKESKAVILASDGLWDELEKSEVAKTFKQASISEVPGLLIEKAMQKAAIQSLLTVEDVRAIAAGKKRNIHDDITIVVIDLHNQVI